MRKILSVGALLAALIGAFPGVAQAARTDQISTLVKYDLSVINLVGSGDALTFSLIGSVHVDSAERVGLDVDAACWADQQITIGRLPLEITSKRPKFFAKGAVNPDGSFSFPMVAAKAGRYVAVLRPLESSLSDRNACLMVGYSNIVTVTAPEVIDLPTS